MRECVCVPKQKEKRIKFKHIFVKTAGPGNITPGLLTKTKTLQDVHIYVYKVPLNNEIFVVNKIGISNFSIISVEVSRASELSVKSDHVNSIEIKILNLGPRDLGLKNL